MRDFKVIRAASGMVVAFVLLGCGSGPPATVAPGRTAAPSTSARATPGGGPPSAAQLCAAFTATLATAALGKPVDPPESGDVLPRPNGVYCAYHATGDPNTRIDAQLKGMTRAEFDALSETLGVTTPLPGAGDVAYGLDRSFMGVNGATVLAWSNGLGVTVDLHREGTQAEMLGAATAVAAAALASI